MKAGGKLEQAPRDELFGDRVAKVIDPFGHRWSLHTRLEEVSPEELMRRIRDFGEPH